MSVAIDAVVIGGGTSGLVAAIALAEAGRKVVVAEAANECGGLLRSVEFAPGFRASPLAGSVGWIPPEVARGIGLSVAIAPVESVFAPVGKGEWLELGADPVKTAAGIQRYAPKDAARWGAFAGLINRLAGFLGTLYVSPPPRIDVDTFGEVVSLLKVGRKLRGLGKVEMVEMLRVMPMAVAELLDEWFEHDLLKGTVAADAITDLCQGPLSGGTAFNLLHRHVGGVPGAVRARPNPSAGELIKHLIERAKAAGVEIRTGATVERITIRDDHVGGVVLRGAGEIPCGRVVSSLDPYRSVLELVDPVHLDPEFIRSIRNIRFRGAAAKVLVGLDGLPALPEHFSGAISISPSIRHLERAYDATKYGRASDDPYLEVRFPTLAGGVAPSGRHVAVIHVQFAPYRLRDGTWDERRESLGDRVIQLVDERLPGFASRVQAGAVYTPPDLEREFGLREGAVGQGELMLDQILFMRPVAGWSRYATPIPGLFWCGSGTHPGPGVVGVSGWMAAQAALKG